jgi:opacity protein-like surface antigen
MRRMLLAAGLMAAGIAPALAQDNDSGFYLGVGGGQFDVEIDDVDTANGIQEAFEGDDTVFKVFGGWRFNPFIGIELDYIDLGGPDDTIANVNFETKISGIAPYLTGTLPIGPIEVFARVGYYFYDVEVNSQDVSLDDSGEDLAYAIGGGVTLFEHLHARIEYEIIDVSEVDDANVVWLSAAWRF